MPQAGKSGTASQFAAAGRKGVFPGGVENLLNEEYESHLEGINRVPGSDVAVGARLPAPGRFFYASAVWRF